jgi:uncharacterized protein (DUF305 family)
LILARAASIPIAAALLAEIALAACTPPAAAPGRGSAGESASYPYTAADVHFMTAMIGHHAQAIVMAGWAPTHGATASVRTLAERLINSQQDEIASMQQWLRDRGLPVPEVAALGSPAMDHAMAGMSMTDMPMPDLMPGMLSAAQMQRLDEARGAEFDRLFLTSMIQHHGGALIMVSDLFSTPGAGQEGAVFKFASDVNADQSTEIDRMEIMLAGLIYEAPRR